MKYKLTLIAAFIGFSIAGTAQTTIEEYNYLTKGYKEDIVNGRGVKKGYELRELRTLNYNGCFANAKKFFRVTDTTMKIAAFLITLKRMDADTEYICYPLDKGDGSENVVSKRYENDVPENSFKREVVYKLMSKSINNTHPVYGNYADSSGTKVFQIEPEFPGGFEGWRKFLQRNLNIGLLSQNGAAAGKYTVMLSFLVDKEGAVSDVIAENNPGYGSAEEAVRVIRKGPRWIPAVQDGKNVNYRKRQAITWVVSNN